MPLRKKKISELPLADSLKGLYTIGYKIIDGIKTSVKVSLEDIQTAYQDVVNAIKKSEEATRNANNAAVTANEKASLANTAAANANDTAEHPTYIGTDHYVYKWNKTAQAYDKTDIYTKGDAFSIKKVYVSVAEMEADKGNPDIAEGDFALVNTGDVEDPDNAKLYVKAAGDYEFLVDMSGAIGFTGKTPQFSMGTVTTLEAGVSAIVTVSDDGTDDGGNPKYKINFAIPRGNPGAPFRISGEYATLEALKSAVPDGSAVDGFMAVGTEAPYDYYAWVNGEWVSQGKIAGGNVINFPSALLNLTSGSESSEILSVFGGLDALRATIAKLRSDNCIIVCGNKNGNYTYVFDDYHVNYTDENNFKLSLFDISGKSSINVDFLYMIVALVDGVAEIASKKKHSLVKDSDVLTKTNTSSFTPTGDYQPATKKYADNIGYGKVINADSGTISNDLVGKGFKLTGVDAEERVKRYFGNLSNFRSVVQDIIENHTRYFIHNSNDCRELGCLNAWKNTVNTEHELHFILTGFGDGNLHIKRYSIRITENTDDARFIIVNIINSDNLTTLTKKTAAEYDAIGSKDANTAYCVTD
mgnify:CR=1 FL=1